MKKTKRHQFKYTDPEKAVVQTKSNHKTTPSNKIVPNNLIPNYVNKDLVKTALTISAFVLIVVVLYFIQTKTEILKPVLKLFNL